MKKIKSICPWSGILIAVAGCLNGIITHAQTKIPADITVHISSNSMSIKEVFRQVQLQTGVFVAFSPRTLDEEEKVAVDFIHKPLEQLISKLLQERGLSWQYDAILKRIEIGSAPPKKGPPMISTVSTVSGRVFNSAGTALPGVTVQIKGTTKIAITGDDGLFFMHGVPPKAVLVFTSIGYGAKELPLPQRSFESVILEADDHVLDEAVVQPYGFTSRRKNTGNITKRKVKDLADQPVPNLLNALTGRVPGLNLIQLNGSPGGGSSLLVRGPTSLTAGEQTAGKPITTAPLVLFDGVPFPATGVTASGDLMRALNTGLSSFASLNLDDLESIELLKDADATAIYGARGGNGVLLLTSKRGQPGNTQIHLSAKAGYSQLNNNMKLVNTAQYLQLRRAALENDNLPVTHHEFTTFDTNSHNNLTRQLLECPSYLVNAQASISGGNSNTQFYLGAGYWAETTTYTHPPGEPAFGASKPSFHLTLDHSSGKLKLAFSGTYAGFNNRLAGNDPFQLPTLFAPHYPAFQDSDGQLTTAYKGIPLSNGIAALYNEYKARANNLLVNLTLSYQLLPELRLTTAMGHSSYQTDESLVLPRKALPVTSRETNSAIVRNASINNAIIEPQLEYESQVGPGKLRVLTGATWQVNKLASVAVSGRNFLPDNLDGFLSLYKKDFDNKTGGYAYQAIFGRINYNIRNTYIINLSGRRDGSSRFAPGKRFSLFGAAGAAYVFHLPGISFGKLRASYGTNGNDGIGENQYVATYTPMAAYQEQGSLQPATLFNGDFGWEKSNKLEGALELGFWKKRVFVSLVWYQTRTGNQLLNEKLPSQTGFINVLQNSAALVQNRGVELEINTINCAHAHFKWNTHFNISINKNKLLAFPNLEKSAYANDLAINEPVTVRRGFILEKIEPLTGIYRFTDQDGNGKLDKKDYRSFDNSAPAFYGGLGNDLLYKRWTLNIFLSFHKQTGANFLKDYGVPGSGIYTPPVEAMQGIWQQPNDNATQQILTQSTGNAAYKAATEYLPKSNLAYSDASYIRFRTIRLSCQLPKNTTLFLQAQNYFTITGYKGPDPEYPGFKTMPPLKTIAAGCAVSF